ncbi:MAG: peptidase [Cyanobacteria bacterium P01_A01_bin.83]
MSRLFRKYHRWLAIICSLPLFLTVITGIAFPLAKSLHQRQLARWLIHVHTMEILGLDEWFPIINGLGSLGLLITGVYLIVFPRQRSRY